MVSVFIFKAGKWVLHWNDIDLAAAKAEVKYLTSCGVIAEIFRRV